MKFLVSFAFKEFKLKFGKPHVVSGYGIAHGSGRAYVYDAAGTAALGRLTFPFPVVTRSTLLLVGAKLLAFPIPFLILQSTACFGSR